MRTRILFLALIGAASAWGAYTYDIVQVTGTQSWYMAYGPWAPFPVWIVNGTAPYFASTDGTWDTKPGFSSAGSLIAIPTVPGTAGDYEVNTRIAIASGGGTYISFLRASSNALASSGSCTGSYISVEIAVSSTYTTGAPAQLNVKQCTSGSLSSLHSASVAVVSGMTIRSVIWGTNLWVFLDDQLAAQVTVPSTTGQPGIGGYGMTSPSGLINLMIGHRDTTAPPAGPPASGMRSSILPTQVSLEWQGAADDANGIGVAGYHVHRGTTDLGFHQGAKVGDASLAAGSPYTYTVNSVDFHGNESATSTSWTINTPPSGSVDPRRVGLYNAGSYWGGGGEQIDTLSGNLNFSVPLVSARARTGWSVSVGLNYNSQNWRKDGSGTSSETTWGLGDDVGVGYGWKAQIGSITPYYREWPNGVYRYVFTDGTGAEYQLDQQSGGVWSSKQGMYVWFDAYSNVLHFKDGSFWLMGNVSSGAEQDAGTLYPTVLEDVSGNQVIVTYAAAPSVPGSLNNTSSRISSIQGVQSGGYTFVYTTDAIPPSTAVTPPRLKEVTQAGTSNKFTLDYSQINLAPPSGWGSSFSGGTVLQLKSVKPAVIGSPYAFTYDSYTVSGAATSANELQKVQFPWGGHIRWEYRDATYAGSRVLREVQNRYLQVKATGTTEVGVTPYAYVFSHSDSSGTIGTVHADTQLVDPSTVGAKKWVFSTSDSTFTGSTTGTWQIGLATDFFQFASASGAEITHDNYTWGLNGSGNPFIKEKISTADGAISSKTAQTLDVYGNLTQLKLFTYYTGTTAPTTPIKKYDNTYKTDSGYLSNYVRNRLVDSKLTPDGGTQITLVTNTYDTSGSTLACSTSHPCPTAQFDATPPVPLANRGLVAGSVTLAKTTTNVYYAYGALYSTSDTDGSSLTNAVSSTTNYAAPDSITTPTYSNALAYDSWLGMTQTTGLNGEQMYMTYDGFGRPETATSPYGTYGSPTVSYTYSGSGVLPAWQTKSGPDGLTTTTLDGLGRPIQVVRATPSGTTQSTTETVYAACACSPLAKIYQTSQPYAPGGTPVYTTYSYDGIGRTLTVQQPDGSSTTHYSYTGNQTTVTDPAGKWKTFTSDVEGNLTTVVEPNPAGGTFTTSYMYDWMNHLTCSNMTRGGTAGTAHTYADPVTGVTCYTTFTGGTGVVQDRTFIHDTRGRLTSTWNPESGAATYTYNTDNTLATKTDAKSVTTTYSYDTKKRLTGAAPSTGCGTVTYGWDTNTVDGSFTAANTAGRLATVQYADCATNSYSSLDPSVSGTSYAEMYSYHPAGGVTTKRMKITHHEYWESDGYWDPVVNLDVGYAYDAAGRVHTTTVPFLSGGGGETQPAVTYTTGFDSMGRPASLVDNNALTAPDGSGIQWVQSVVYDYAGRRTSLQRYLSADGAGGELFMTETASFNVNGQLASMGWSGATGVNDTITYCYTSCSTPSADNGQITQMKDLVSGETITYAYDELKRLTSATGTVTIGGAAVSIATYGYDGFGNLTSKGTGVSTVTSMVAIGADAGTNRLSSTSYDLNGNRTGFPGATLAYDENNRMMSVTTTSANIEKYGYSPDNKRVHKMDRYGHESWILYGARGEKVGVYALDFSGSIVQTETDVSFGGKLIWQGGAGSAVYQDRLGTNRAGGSFLPYGEYVAANDRNGFATYTRDSFTTLDYADQRYYDNSVGRFNTADPSMSSVGPADPGSWNRYSYTRGDPVNRFDPRGLADWSVDVTASVSDLEGHGSALASIGAGNGRFANPGLDLWGAGDVAEGYSDPGSDTSDISVFGENGARSALGKPECAKRFGFTGSNATKDAQAAFGKIDFQAKPLGQMTVQDTPAGISIVAGGPAPAQTIGNTITINTDVNFFDLSNVTAKDAISSTNIIFNLLQAENQLLGTNMTGSQFASLIVLHEFKHSSLGGNAPQETDNYTFNIGIFNDCIK